MVRSLLFCSMPQMQKWASCSHMVAVPLVHKGLFCVSFFGGCVLGQWALTGMGHPHYIFSWLTALRNAVSSVIYQVLIYSELIYCWIPYLQCEDALQDLTGIVCLWHVAAWTVVLLGPPLTFGLDVHTQKVCGNWGGEQHCCSLREGRQGVTARSGVQVSRCHGVWETPGSAARASARRAFEHDFP